jgi:hypothetical protein
VKAADTTPLGLNFHTKRRFPKVARSEQPWALLRNPFGIEMGLLATLRGLEMGRLDEGGYGADINERFVATMRTEKVWKL